MSGIIFMSLDHLSSSSSWADIQERVISPEISLSRQSLEVKAIVERDPILRGNLDKISNLEEFFQKLEENKHIFTQLDNPEPKKKFLEQHIKGLGHWQYASNGKKFEELASLSTEEMGKLPFAMRMEVKKWRQEQLDQAAIARKSGEQEIDKAAIEMDEKLEKLKGFVQSAQESLNPEWQKFIDTQVWELRNNTQALTALGIPEDEKNNPKYDNLIRASAILGAKEDPNFMIQYVKSGDRAKFDSAIKSISELSIAPYAVSPEKVDKHIDSRFPKSDSTERAKREIRDSIESWSVRDIIYDGKWEKYTLLARDGKTMKEVYMNPPRTVVRDGYLSIDRETPKREPSESEVRQEALRSRIKKDILPMSDSPLVWALSTSLIDSGKWDFSIARDSDKPEDQLRYTYSALGKKQRALEWLIREMRKNGEESEVKNLEFAKNQVEEQIKQVESLANAYQKSLEERAREPRVIDEFDRRAWRNLDWLREKKFDKMGSRASEALTRIVDEVNRGRDRANQISLANNDLKSPTETRKVALEEAFEKLSKGYNLSNGDDIMRFERYISDLLSYPPSHSDSLEWKMRKIEQP